MKFVFDASALLNLIRLAGSDAFNYLNGNYISSLTLYGVGNALWREAALLSRISVGETYSLLELINNMCKILNNIVNPRDNLVTLKLACELKITYYDASYIVASHELDAALVTDDEKLRKKIRLGEKIISRILGKMVNIYSTKELLKSIDLKNGKLNIFN